MPVVINQALVEKLEKELKNEEDMMMAVEDKIDRDSFVQQSKGTGRRLSLCRFLNRYAEEHGLEKDFIILKASMFTSNFSKNELQNVQIVFNYNGNELVFCEKLYYAALNMQESV